MAGHREQRADPLRCRPNDDNFASIFGCRYFAVQHVVKRICRESGLAIAAFVKLRQHDRGFVRLHAQFANLYGVTGVQLDVACSQVQTVD